MGRKSRLKRDRLKLEDSNLPTELIDQLILLENHHESIYRFFPEEWQADALVNGNVWLSTLKTCRRYEDPEQGDAHEASENYNSGYAVGGSDDSGFKEVARRSGIHIGSGCSNITIDNKGLA